MCVSPDEQSTVNCPIILNGWAVITVTHNEKRDYEKVLKWNDHDEKITAAAYSGAQCARRGGHAECYGGLAVLAPLTQWTGTKIKAFPASCCVIKMNFIMPCWGLPLWRPIMPALQKYASICRVKHSTPRCSDVSSFSSTGPQTLHCGAQRKKRDSDNKLHF